MKTKHPVLLACLLAVIGVALLAMVMAVVIAGLRLGWFSLPGGTPAGMTAPRPDAEEAPPAPSYTKPRPSGAEPAPSPPPTRRRPSAAESPPAPLYKQASSEPDSATKYHWPASFKLPLDIHVDAPAVPDDLAQRTADKKQQWWKLWSKR